MAFNSTVAKTANGSTSLGAIVAAQVSSLSAVRGRVRAVAEANFQRAVMDGGLSYRAQVEFRKSQVAAALADPAGVDEEYLASLRKAEADARKLARFQDIREAYLQSYEGLKSGKIGLAQHLSFLESQIASVDDEDARKEIRDEITSVRTQIAEAEANTLKNRVQLASKDGTVAALTSAIAEVSDRRARASLSGNDEEASSWDISILSLKKQLGETRIVNGLHDMDLSMSRATPGAMGKLEALAGKVASADSSAPVSVDGVRYGSEKEYWTSLRDSYISGSGSGRFQDFFGDLQGDVKLKIDTVSKVNPFSFVPVSTLEAIQRDYDSLAARPEFAPSAERLTASKVAALGYGVEVSAAAIASSSVETLQLSAGQDALRSLQSKFGIDTTAQKFDLQSKIIAKGSQLKGIKEATQQLAAVGAETPPAEVPSSVEPASVFSSSKKPSETPGIMAPVKEPVVPAAPAAPAEPQFTEYVVKAGDTLSKISKQFLGDAGRYGDIAKANAIADPNRISIGMKIKVPKL